MLKFLPGNLKLAVAVVAGWRLLQNVRRNHLSKAGREKRLLKEETSFVMAEIENPEFLKELCAGKSDSNDENLAPLGDGEAYSPVLSACRQLPARQSTERRHGGRPHTSRLSEKLQELKRGVEADGGFPICAIVNGDLERSLLRFLISTDFDVGKAREKIAAMKQWREENDIVSPFPLHPPMILRMMRVNPFSTVPPPPPHFLTAQRTKTHFLFVGCFSLLSGPHSSMDSP